LFQGADFLALHYLGWNEVRIQAAGRGLFTGCSLVGGMLDGSRYDILRQQVAHTIHGACSRPLQGLAVATCLLAREDVHASSGSVVRLLANHAVNVTRCPHQGSLLVLVGG